MAKLKASLLGLKAQGSIGKSITYAHTLQGTVAKSFPTHADAQTLPQLYQRWHFVDAKYYWHSLTQSQRDTYETDARPLHMTGWALFLRQYLSNPLDQVLWLHLDELSGSQASDFSGKNNHGVFYGTESIDGVVDRARHFDSSDDYISCGTDPTLFPDIFTTMAWCRTTESNPNPIVAWHPWGYVQVTTSHYLNFSLIQLGNACWRWFKNIPVNILDGKWHHLVFIVPGNGPDDIDNSLMYADGQLQLVQGTVKTTGTNAKSLCRIGRAQDWYFGGDLDDLRIYNRILSLAHILEIYNNQRWPLPVS